MSLDILTPKGIESLNSEGRLLRSFIRQFPQYSIVQTPKSKASDIDGMIYSKKTNEIVAIFESKCRACDMAQMSEWGWTWLVTFDKLLRGVNLAQALKVPFYGLLYLTNEPLGISIKIADENGNFIPKIELEVTQTQRTINGGVAERTNAYIHLQPMHTRFPIHD
jgi:hypothetical protein